MERHFETQGLRAVTGMELSSNEAIKRAVEVGLGLGIVSIHTLELELETGRLVMLEVESFPIPRHWHLVHRRGKRLSPVAMTFREFVLREARGLVIPVSGAVPGLAKTARAG
jgi:DNA-binding transcriptional LysR family regulator